MARPIEPTPPITGADADRLLDELEQVAPPEEIAQRRDAARRFLAQVSAPSRRLPPHANAEVHARIMADLRTMTPAEFMETLVQAGICTPDGRLSEHYAEGAEGAGEDTPPG